MMKGSIPDEDVTIVNIYAPNIGAPQYIRQMRTAIKAEIDSNTIIVGDFNTPLTPMNRKLIRRGGGGVMNWQIGIDIYTLICIKWITNKKLLHKKIKLNFLKKEN